MFKPDHKLLTRVAAPFLTIFLGVLFSFGAATTVQANPPPPNDTITNAQGIIGATGTILGTNLYATADTNEPAAVTNFPPQATIWYVWTAPYTTTEDFNTRGSTDPNTGLPLDTLLAVYTLKSGTNLNYTNLVRVASNNNDPNSVYGPVSRVDFAATLGTNYYIQVDGATNASTGTNAARGTIQLNWMPSLVGGQFQFSTPVFVAGQDDDELLVDYGGNSVGPSLAYQAGDANVKITVTRQGPARGQVQVTMILTNGEDSNTAISNYTGTNIYILNFNTNTAATNYTNTYFTNVAVQIEAVDYISSTFGSATLVTNLVQSIETFSQTNANNTLSPVYITFPTFSSIGLTNFFTNFSCVNQYTTNLATNGSFITTTVTQIFCYFVTNMTMTASSSTVPLTTNLVFNDFQMSRDVYIQINPSLFGPDFPDQNGNELDFGLNEYVNLSLTNPIVAPGESLDITPPTLTGNSNAILNILNLYGNPGNYVGSPTGLTTNTGAFEYNTLNFERATFRVAKGTPIANLYAVLDGPGAPASTVYTFHYTIDSLAAVDLVGATPISAFNYDRFTTVASSDYAQPAYYNIPDADFGNPINDPIDPSAHGVGINTIFPAEKSYIGSFTIGPGVNSSIAEIAIPILTNGAVEFNMDMQVEIFETLSDAQGNSTAPVPCLLGNIPTAILTINSGLAEAGGANDVSFNVDNEASSYPPNNLVPGANGGVGEAVAIQGDGKAVIGGDFSSYNTSPIYGVARLLTNGFLDPSFNAVQQPGVNINGIVTAIVIDASGRIIIAGSFNSYDGASAINIARLNTNGLLDTNFATGLGFNSDVATLALDGNGNILAGGDFTTYNAASVNHIVRILPSGALDPSFVPNTGNGAVGFGANDDVYAIGFDLNSNILVGGDFTSFNGTNENFLTRLTPNGSSDPTFNTQVGPDSTVMGISVQSNNEVIIVGTFQNYDLNSRAGIALVTTSGLLDTNFTPGTGVDGDVLTVLTQPNGNIVIGGAFRNVNGSRRASLARFLPNGYLDTSFMDTSFNQYAGLITEKYNDPTPSANQLALQPDGNIMMVGSFTNVGGGNSRTERHTKISVARIIGAPTPGPQTGGGGIGNIPGNITLTQNPYTVDDTGTKLFVTLDRINGSLGPAQLTLGTNTLAPGSGSATKADFGLIFPDIATYGEVWSNFIILPAGNYSWRKCDGYFGFNNAIQPITDNGASQINIAINNDPAALQNLYASLSELNVNSQNLLVLGGVPIPLYPALGLPTASLIIVNDNFPVGDVGFNLTNYIALDTSNSVTITVVRTNGSSGPLSVNYSTANGTAVAGANYSAVTGTLRFPGGSSTNTSASFTVPIIPQSTVQPTKFFNVLLSSPSVSGIFDTNVPPFVYSNSIVSIIDGNFAPGHLSFSSSSYSVIKGGTATITVDRSGGALGQLTAQVVTSDGTGSNGLNYVASTNTVTFGNQDVTPKTVTVQTLQDNTVDGTLLVDLSLVNATNISSSGSNNLIITSPSNAVLSIVDNDSFGGLSFVVPNFNVLQNAGQALITVVRTNGVTGTISANFTTSNGGTNVTSPETPAVAGTNYGATNGVLVFGPGVTSQSFLVPILNTPGTNDGTPANRVVNLSLFNGSPSNINTALPAMATITILDPQLILNPAGSVDQTTATGTGFNSVVDSIALQPDGSLLAGGNFTFFNQFPFNYLARLNFNSLDAFDSTFLANQVGPNNTVLQVVSQPTGTGSNGPIVIAGTFNQVDQVTRNGIARLNLDGTIDESFNPGAGADSTIFSVVPAFVPSTSGNGSNVLSYYVGGAFANYDGVAAGSIARISGATNSASYQGTLDPNFNIGQGVTGSNGAVHAIGVQANGQVVAGGDFTAFNGVTYNHLVRLNEDGSVDSTFNPSTGSSVTGSVRALAVQPDGRILIGGLFTNVNGSNYNFLSRLNTDGTLDTNFNLGLGANNTVLAITLDSQNRILVGGEFTQFSGVTRSGITRLNPDGTVDPTINFGSGVDGGFVDTIVVQTNDEIDVGGGFATFDGLTNNNFVRLYGGANFGNGAIQFTIPFYGVLESGTNAIITLQRLGGEGTAAQTNATVYFSTSDGTGVAGVDYVGVTNQLVTFPLGETFETITIPILNNNLVASNKTVNLNLSNPSGATIGAQASAVLVITNVNAAIEFGAANYRQSEGAPSGNAIISVLRIGDPDSTVSVTVSTGNSGTATPGVDYTPVTTNVVFSPGVISNTFFVPVLNATNMLSDQTVDLELSSPSNASLGSPSSALLTISSVNNGPGVVVFSQTNYTVTALTNGITNATITIVRTNGSSGSVSVTLVTSNNTALSGINYSNIITTINFADGEVSQSITIPILPEPLAGPSESLFLDLINPIGTTIGGNSQEVLTILNGNESISFTNTPYIVSEGTPIVNLTIVRAGSLTNSATISYFTYTPPGETEANGYAVPNVDYVPASGTVTFGPNQASTTIPISIIQGNVVNGLLTFQVNLDNPTPSGVVQIGPPSSATIVIVSDVTGFELSSSNYTVGENGSNVVITVDRINTNTGTASVHFATSDGSAVSGTDYVATNGTLTFSNGQASSSFTVSILNANTVEANKTFNVTLSNPLVITATTTSTNAFLVAPSSAVVTITNVLSGVGFASSSYTVSECAAYATVAVDLIGSTNSTVTVGYSTMNGSASAGTNYTATNGILTFLPGQTVQTFQVPINNNHIIGPNHTVLLTLSNAVGAQLLNPSVAVLTIQECNGAYIVQSGTAFVSGSVSNSGGVIFPNETVTLLLGLRDVAGSNTMNLVATLLATNGITNVSGANAGSPSNVYGVLITNGPTVFRPFTFEALGTNGQNISATLSLYDGSTVYSNVSFGFTLGGSLQMFGTNEVLLLTGSNNPPSKAHDTNAPYYGYPSVVNVAGVAGNVTAVTATLSNLSHTYPADVAVVLENPESADTYLMADTGGSVGVSNVTLTFSQSATKYLPQSSAITSGTYLPTDYYTYNEPLPTNGPSLPRAPVGPFPTNLNVFNGQAPNGNWYLFVADDNSLDSGSIKGWSLNITTGLPVEEDADLELALSTVQASATFSNTLTYTFSVTNYGPATATNVIITDTLPFGVTYVTNSCGCGVITNGILTISAGTLAVSNGVSYTVQVLPGSLGYLTNIVTATANQPDPNSNNSQTNVILVSPSSADLAVSFGAGSPNPNPVLDGSYVTYTIYVTNNGPSSASGIMATNTLPAGFIPITVTPSQGTTTNVNGVIIWSIGTLGSSTNSGASLVIVAGVTLPENSLPSSTSLDQVSVGYAGYDPGKFNNFAAVKSEVEPDLLTLSVSGMNYVLTWPYLGGNVVLQGTTNLPAMWVTLSSANISQQVVNGQTNDTYILSTNSIYHFFRLESQLP